MLLRALKEACEGREKLIALEAFPGRTEGTAKSELSKILAGERGESVVAVLDTILRFGDREKLRAYFDGRLRPGVETTLRELDQVQGIQLSLLDPLVSTLDEVRRLRDQLEEQVQRQPLERRKA